jgi:cardiolipin synthase
MNARGLQGRADGLALSVEGAIPCAIAAASRWGKAADLGDGRVTTPNLITIGRLLCVPLIVWLIVAGYPVVAFWVFIAAGLSDAVDGFIARQLDERSDLGAYLDPLADKVLLVSIYVALSTLGEIPLWVTILVVSRDFFIVGGIVLSWMLDAPMPLRPSAISKVNTLAQIVLAAIVLGDLAFSPELGAVRAALSYVVGVLTIASAGFYLVDWGKHMAVSASASVDQPPDERR